MTFLPIVDRELRVAARRAGTYRLRLITALVALGIFGWMMLTLWREAVPSTAHGQYLFRSLIALGFAYCLVAGVRLTADCLSEEKREGTLGLLFLTDLRGYDVVLGKLAATSVTSVYGLVAIIPVIALTVQLGGVTAMEVVRAALVLLNTLFLSLSAGMLASTVSRHERKSMFAGVLLVLGLTLGPWVVAMYLGSSTSGILDDPRRAWLLLIPSPAYGLGWTLMSGPRMPMLPFPAMSFWWSLLCVHLTGWGMLWAAGRILPRTWQQQGGGPVTERWRGRLERVTFGTAEERTRLRRELLDINPFLWLAGRERWKPSYVWLYLAAVGGTWLWGLAAYGGLMVDSKTMVPGILLVQTFFKVWILSEACSRLSEDQRSGALELLLSTPMSVRQILRGQWQALRRQFAWPMSVMAVAVTLGAAKAVGWELAWINLVVLLVDAVALGWVGMWLGLTARNPSRAILGGVGRLLVLPWGVFYAGGLLWAVSVRWIGLPPPSASTSLAGWIWLVISLITSVGFGFIWAARHLEREFRTIAVQRHEGPERRRGWRARFGPARAR